MQIINKNKHFSDKKNANTDIQQHFKERFTENINKYINNGIHIISYRELLDEGMSEESFYEVINLYIENNWQIVIKEFDIELQ